MKENLSGHRLYNNAFCFSKIFMAKLPIPRVDPKISIITIWPIELEKGSHKHLFRVLLKETIIWIITNTINSN